MSTQQAQNLFLPRHELLFEGHVHREARQGELHRCRCLDVGGVSETGAAHLIEHAPDAFAEFLPKAQFGAHPGYARVARESHHLTRVGRVGQTGESARAVNLDPIVEDLAEPERRIELLTYSLRMNCSAD